MTLTGAFLPELQAGIGYESIATTVNVYGRMLTDVQPAALAAFSAIRAGRRTEELGAHRGA